MQIPRLSGIQFTSNAFLWKRPNWLIVIQKWSGRSKLSGSKRRALQLVPETLEMHVEMMIENLNYGEILVHC